MYVYLAITASPKPGEDRCCKYTLACKILVSSVYIDYNMVEIWYGFYHEWRAVWYHERAKRVSDITLPSTSDESHIKFQPCCNLFIIWFSLLPSNQSPSYLASRHPHQHDQACRTFLCNWKCYEIKIIWAVSKFSWII